MKRRVVITGYGLVTPLGCDVGEVWSKMLRGESGIALIQDEKLRLCKSKIAGECLNFTTEPYIKPHEARRLERFVQMAMVSTIKAVQMADLDFDTEDKTRACSVIGSGVGGLLEIEMQHKKLLEKGPSKVSPFTIPKIMINAAAGNVSIFYGLLGPTYGVASACASANNAMIDAFRIIQEDEADVVITGGTEVAVTSLGLAGFDIMRALSVRNDEPQRACRPFDKDRDGFVISEGGGILVFESEEHALARGATIYGEMLGYGVTSDGTHITQPDEDGAGAARALQLTLKKSGLNPEDVQYINAHGTSTILGDIAETRAIKRAFGDHAKKVAISSTKSQIGHSLGGSAAVEMIMTLLTIQRGVVPPTINLDNPDPECDLDYTPNVAKECPVRTAISNSFGFGGHNACIAVGRYG